MNIPNNFVNVLNLSQLIKPIQLRQDLNTEKANEVLDTNIFELLPSQPSRQDEIDRLDNTRPGN